LYEGRETCDVRITDKTTRNPKPWGKGNNHSVEGLLWPSTEDQEAMKMENIPRLLEIMG